MSFRVDFLEITSTNKYNDIQAVIIVITKNDFDLMSRM